MDSIKGVMFGKRPSYLPVDSVSSTSHYSSSSSSSSGFTSFSSEEDSTYPSKYRKKQTQRSWLSKMLSFNSGGKAEGHFNNQSKSKYYSFSSLGSSNNSSKYGGYYAKTLNNNGKSKDSPWSNFFRTLDIREIGVYSLISFFFLFVSVGLVFLGISICRSSAYNMKLSCTTQSCEFVKYSYSTSSIDPMNQVTFPRSFLLKSSPVRVRNGIVVQADKYRGKKARALGHSYIIKVKSLNKEKEDINNSGDGWTEEEILIADFNIGRKKARKQAGKITSYIRGEVSQVEVIESRGWSASGIILVLIGSLAVIFVVVLGDFTGKKDKKIRKQR